VLRSLVHIVDDDPLVRDATSFLLRSIGYETQLYSSGTEFLDQADLGQGCILLDLRMPGLSGAKVQEELARRQVALPLVVLSGHGDIDTAVEAMKLGALDFIEKPYEEERLLSVLERAFSTAGSRQRKARERSDAREKIARLSSRELQVLRGLLASLANKMIARRLDLSYRTVDMYRARLLDKLEVGSTSEAVRIAFDAGLEPLDGSDA
jgi:two-component system response regulator FixJ